MGKNRDTNFRLVKVNCSKPSSMVPLKFVSVLLSRDLSDEVYFRDGLRNTTPLVRALPLYDQSGPSFHLSRMNLLDACLPLHLRVRERVRRRALSVRGEKQ